MLRVSSLGLTCRRHALYSYHLAAHRHLRVVAVAGKASIPEVHHQVFRVAVHPGGVCMETPVVEDAAMEVAKEAKEEEEEALSVKGVVPTENCQPHESEGEYVRTAGDVIAVPLRKTVRPLHPYGPRRSSKVVRVSPPAGRSRRNVDAQQSIRNKYEDSLMYSPLAKPVKRHCQNTKASVKIVTEPPFEPLYSRPEQKCAHLKAKVLRPYRWRLLQILATTNSLSEAWHAYETLLSLPHRSPLPIPFEHLHRLTRLIATIKPRTLPHFIRLLSVMSLIRKNGGRVQLWQWNALIDFAGKGWRRTRQQNFRKALLVYNDLISQKPPGAGLMRSDHDCPQPPTEINPMPDIVTQTTLLNIAARTKHKRAMIIAASLQLPDVPPDRMTLLTFLRHYARTGDMDGVRRVVSLIAHYQYDIGLDGINAYIWAYGRNGHLEVASAIYTVLTSRYSGQAADHWVPAAAFLKDTESIVVPDNLLPDQITYTALLQAYAYHGHLNPCLRVFKDYVVSVKSSGSDEQQFLLTMQMSPIYRAIFVGFSRHGRSHSSSPSQHTDWPLGHSTDTSTWRLEALEALFADFLAVPAGVKVTPRTIYAILVAFFKVSGKDTRKVREIYLKLEARFPGHWGGRLDRLRRKLFTS